MVFQTSDDKGRNFLDLINDENNPLEPSYSKGGTQLQYFDHSNSLCARASRAIVNYVPTGEYCLRLNISLKNIKSDVIADYIQSELIGITIVTNKVTLLFNLQVIENYVKNIENECRECQLRVY